MQTLTIGILSKEVGISTKTIRFYEDVGLIAKPARAENGYRMYSENVKGELLLIKNARDLGLPISEIKKLMIGCEDGNCQHTKEYIQHEVGSYVSILDKRIQQLQKLRNKLKNLKTNIILGEDCGVNGYCCNILKQIEDSPKGGEK